MLTIGGNNYRKATLTLGETEEGLKTMIRAEAYTDDRYVVVDEFDAEPWFEQATDTDFEELLGAIWGWDVADYMAESNEQLDDLFCYLRTVRELSEDTCLFECWINEDDAKSWIAQNRPHLMPMFEAAEEEGVAKTEVVS